MKRIRIFLIPCLIACSESGQETMVVVEAEPVQEEVSHIEKVTADETPLHFVHDTYGKFFLCSSIFDYDTSIFKPVNYNTELGPVSGLEHKIGQEVFFNLQTNYDTSTVVLGITSNNPEFRLSNGVYLGMTVANLLELDTNLIFYNAGGDLASHFGGTDYYAFIRDIGTDVDRTIEFSKALNKRVNPQGIVNGIWVWKNNCD